MEFKYMYPQFASILKLIVRILIVSFMNTTQFTIHCNGIMDLTKLKIIIMMSANQSLAKGISFGKFFCGTLSQPHFGINVRMKLTPPKVGSWSPPEFLKIQSSSSRVKTPHIEVFFISMERS